jgi:hypothetical protein
MTRREYSISAEEADYLENLAAVESPLADILSSFGNWRTGHGTLSLWPHQAESLREYFTERLARVGFDADYRPNAEGQLLEKFIDNLYSAKRD